MQAKLRLFNGFDNNSDPLSAPSVSMTFGELSTLLIDAVRLRRTWLKDFSDDEVHISEDLYEVLLAYSRLRPGA